MDLGERIRKAIREDSAISRSNRWDPDTQPNLYELSNFLRKSGYRLVDVINHGTADSPSIELLIEAVKESHLHPEISHDPDWSIFYVNVEEHGLLEASDLEEIIKGYTTALGVVNHLAEVDLSTLEIESED